MKLKSLGSLLLCICMVLASGLCSAQEEGRVLYVDAASSGGDGSQQAPFSTLQEACNVVQPGDTVLVAPGIYYGTTNLKNAGTAEKPIVFRAQESGLHAVTLSGADRKIREKKTKWTLEDASLGLYSVPFDHDPARVTCDDMDLQGYNTLEGLKKFELVEEKNSAYLRGAKCGYVFVPEEQKLYLRLRPDDKWGSRDPNDHTIAVPTAPVYESLFYDGAQQSGYKGNCIGDDSYIFGIITEDTPSHVVLDGFTFEAPGFAAVFIRGSHVTVRNAYFRGCRSGVSGGSRYIGDQFYTDHVTVELCDYTQYPVYEDAKELIEEYYMDEDVRRNSFYWWQRKGLESGDSMPMKKDYETGGFVTQMGNYWTLRNNDLTECFDAMPWQSFTSFKVTDENGKTRDYGPQEGQIEIYHNRFYRSVDNAIEFENCAYNVRVYENEFIDNYMGISWQPMGGVRFPTNISIYKNIFYNSEEHGKMWMDKAGYPGSFVKIGAEKDQWGWWPWMDSQAWNSVDDIPYRPVTPEDRGMLFFNNTIYNPYTIFLEKVNGDGKMKMDNFHFVNNLFVTYSKQNLSTLKADLNYGEVIQKDLGFSFSHNLFAPSVDDMWCKPGDVINDGGFAVSGPSAIGFKSIENMDFTLTENSPAIGAGVLIEGEPASSKDLGAVPYGTQYRKNEVGPRPFGDTNLDGRVDAADLAYVLAQLALSAEENPDHFCDLNFDGAVSQSDYDLLESMLMQETEEE